MALLARQCEHHGVAEQAARKPPAAFEALGRFIHRHPGLVTLADAVVAVMAIDVARDFDGNAHGAWNWLVLGVCTYSVAIQALFQRVFVVSEKLTPDTATAIRFTFAQVPAIVAFTANSIGASDWSLVLGLATTVVLTAVTCVVSARRA